MAPQIARVAYETHARGLFLKRPIQSTDVELSQAIVMNSKRHEWLAAELKTRTFWFPACLKFSLGTIDRQARLVKDFAGMAAKLG
jgi:hypothetical protein